MIETPTPNPLLGYMEEYRALRSELLEYLSGESNYRNFAIIITGIVIGVISTYSNSSILFVFSTLAVGFLWSITIDRLKSIYRIATYIEVFIEPKIPGLMWETLVGKNLEKRKPTLRALAYRGDFIFLYGLNLYIYISSVARSWSLLSLVLITILIGLYMYFLINTILLSTSRQNEKAAWQRILNSLESC